MGYIALHLKGIENPEMGLWSPIFKILKKHPKFKIISPLENLDQSHQSAEAEGTSERRSNIDLNDMENDPPEAILFACTPEFLDIPNQLPSNIPLACFFGGIGPVDYRSQYKKSTKLNIAHLISDVLPDELAPHFEHEVFENLKHKLLFFPTLDFGLSDLIPASSKEETLFIHFKPENTTFKSPNDIIYQVLENIPKIRFVRLEKTPVESWIEECNPGSLCKKILVDAPIFALHEYLSEICVSRKIQFEALPTDAVASPIRTFLSGNPLVAEWIKLPEQVQQTSIRQKIADFISSEAQPETQSRSEFKSNKESIDFLIHTFINNKHRETNSKVIVLNEFISAKPNRQPRDTKNHYLIAPLLYLFGNSPLSSTFIVSIDFFSFLEEKNFNWISKKLIIDASLRFACKLPNDHAFFFVLKKIHDVNPSEFRKSLERIVQFNEGFPSLNSLFEGVQAMIYFFEHDSQDKKKLMECCNSLPFPAKLASRFALSMEDYRKFETTKQACILNGVKGIAGGAVYITLKTNPNPTKEMLQKMADICEQEIVGGHDDYLTTGSLALTHLLSENENSLFSCLENPKVISKDPFRFAFLVHETTLLALAKGKNETAAKLLGMAKDSPAGRTFFDKIAKISLNLLLGDSKKAENLANDFPISLHENSWDGKDAPYFTALYISIIMKYCGQYESLKKCNLIMDETKVPYDPILRDLQKKTCASSLTDKKLITLSKFLSKNIPLLSSKKISLTTPI